MSKKESFVIAAIDKRPIIAIPIVCGPFFFICFALFMIFAKNIPFSDLNILLHVCFWSGFVSTIVTHILNPFSKEEMKERFGIELNYNDSTDPDYSTDPAYDHLPGNAWHSNYLVRTGSY